MNWLRRLILTLMGFDWKLLLLALFSMDRRHAAIMGMLASFLIATTGILRDLTRENNPGWDWGTTLLVIVWGWMFVKFWRFRKPSWDDIIDDVEEFVRVNDMPPELTDRIRQLRVRPFR